MEMKPKLIIHALPFFAVLFLNCLVFNNEKSKKEEVKIDTIPPLLILNDATDTIIYVGDHWSDPGYSCQDSVDGDLTDSVKVAGAVDTLVEGEYAIAYTVSDAKGNSAIEKRKVIVLASRGLWADYRFAGNSNDASGNSRHAKIVGTVNPTADRFNRAENAYEFNGTDNSYIVNDNLKGFPSGNSPKTLSGWVKSNAASGLQAFFGIGDDTAKGNFQVAVNTQMRVNGWGSNNDWGTGVQGSGVCNGQWHHLAVTYDSVKTVFYLDGEKKAETSAFRYFTDNAKGKIVIGNEIDFSGWPVKGAIDDVRIYDRTLSPVQVKALYKMNGWSVAADTSSPPDTSTPPDTSAPPEKLTGLTYQIKGTAGSLSLTLNWDAVSSAFAYGVYYDIGKTVTKNGYYRVALKNSYSFVGALTEGEEYTFAVTYTPSGGSESGFSEPLTVLFKAP
jgi:hypothetical protein